MTGRVHKMIGLTLAMAMATTLGLAEEDHPKKTTGPTANISNDAQIVSPEGPAFLGRPMTYWVERIRDRDKDSMELAFDAILVLGPEARIAIPELTRIIAEPFVPIEVGVDDRGEIQSKMTNLQLRSDAVDALAAIGDAAASSTLPLIQWALTIRFIPRELDTRAKRSLFVNLVAIDVLERMRVAGAVASFGPAAVSEIKTLLKSFDGEERKLAVAILNEEALPIATDLLESGNCGEQEVGMAILADMWPVVAKAYLPQLKRILVCEPIK